MTRLHGTTTNKNISKEDEKNTNSIQLKWNLLRYNRVVKIICGAKERFGQIYRACKDEGCFKAYGYSLHYSSVGYIKENI